MRKEYSIIPIKNVNSQDRSFYYRFGSVPENLIESIKEIGITQPLVLRKSPDEKYTIVCGWRRYLAAVSLKLNSIPSYIINSDDITPRDTFYLSLSDNKPLGEFTVIEKSLAIKKALQYYDIEDESFKKNVLPAIGLPPNNEILHRYLYIADTDTSIKEAIDSGLIQPDIAISIAEARMEDKNSLLSLFYALSPGINRQKELFTLLSEIAVRENTTISSIIKSNDVKKILRNEKAGNPQKLAEFIRFLKARRSPHLHTLEKKFETIKKEIKLPPEITLSAPPYFETDRYKINFTFRSEEEYQKHLMKLTELAKNKVIGKLESIIED